MHTLIAVGGFCVLIGIAGLLMCLLGREADRFHAKADEFERRAREAKTREDALTVHRELVAWSRTLGMVPCPFAARIREIDAYLRGRLGE